MSDEVLEQEDESLPFAAAAVAPLSADQIRNRIKEVRVMPFADVKGNPQNFRLHPEFQQRALNEAVATVGFASIPLAYYSARNGGALTWVDGNLRGDLFHAYEGEVAVLDIDDAEADMLMLTLDPIAALAQSHGSALEEAIARVQEGIEVPEAVQDLFDRLVELNGMMTGDFDMRVEDLSEEEDLPYHDDTKVTVHVGNAAAFAAVHAAVVALCDSHPEWGASVD